MLLIKEEEDIQERRQNKLSNAGQFSSPASRVPMPPNLKNGKVLDVMPKTKPVPKPVVVIKNFIFSFLAMRHAKLA